MRYFVLQDVLFPGPAAIGICMSDAAPAHFAPYHGACTNRARGILAASRMDIVPA